MYKDKVKLLEYDRNRKATIRAQRRANGLCTVCGKPGRVGKRECETCLKRRMQKRELLKRKAVEYLGGRCVDCGLQTDIIAVYDFHHKDMDEKAGIISDFLTVKKSWKAIQEELDKCVLLCANCHRIRHAQREEPLP
jgi:hypothetical protein